MTTADASLDFSNIQGFDGIDLEIDIEVAEQKYHVIKSTNKRTFEAKIIGNETKSKIGNTIDVILCVTPTKNTRGYYKVAYKEGAGGKPDCHSADGLRPDTDVFNPVSKNCQQCPLAQYGSYRDGDKIGVACRQRRPFVITPTGGETKKFYKFSLNSPSLRNFNEYNKLLKSKGVQMYQVVTRLSFDEDKNFPVVMFELVSIIDSKIDVPRIVNFLRDKDTWMDMLGLALPKIEVEDTSEDTGFNYGANSQQESVPQKAQIDDNAVDNALNNALPDDF